MFEFHFPWLTATVLLPLVGAACVSAVRDAVFARRISTSFAAAALACALAAWGEFVNSKAASAHDPFDVWHWLLGGEGLAIDTFSAPLVALAALLNVLTAMATLSSKLRRFSFGGALLSESILLATLCCRVPWGIIVLLVLGTLPPLWELIKRRKPTRVYVLHMGLFVVMLVLGWSLVQPQNADGSHAAPSDSWWRLAPLLLAVLIRCGIAPFHCWVTDLFEHATFGTALLRMTPMIGAYAAVRLLLPNASDEIMHAMGFLSLVTAVYAAGMALVQQEARRFFCYIFLSHSALVLVGLDTAKPIGLTGALCVWLSMGLALAGFGLTLRALEARHGRLSLRSYHGLYDHTPMLAICFLLTGLASVGFPGTFGFLGTELLVDGAIEVYPYVGVGVVVAAALNGIAVVQAYFKLFTGTRHVSTVPLTVSWREQFAVLTLAFLIVAGGLFPQPSVGSRHHAAEEILDQRRKTEPHSPPLAAKGGGNHGAAVSAP